jgi:glycosyltransferase involved in cell wall biosynthesis
MARTLLINVEDDGHGGRAQLSGMLTSGLRAIEGDALDILRLPRGSHAPSITERLSGRIDGITFEVERDLLHRLSLDPPGRVFIDGSNLGRIARLIKRARPRLPVITFYHNVEARFFFDSLRAAPSPRAVGVLVANTRAERWATIYSDRRVTLNKRDARLLGRLYGRPGTDLLPMALRDQYDPSAAQLARPHAAPYALFVGGAFYANVEGMAWYAQKVAPHAPLSTVVIGHGMEAHRTRLEQWGGVRVVGSVEDLAQWYAHAQVVVAPILSGSGMKTKTAEALMYGKPVAGTPEAFVGYRAGSTDQLRICETPDAFLDALRATTHVKPGFDSGLRARYEMRHSELALRIRLGRILARTPQKEAEL